MSWPRSVEVQGKKGESSSLQFRGLGGLMHEGKDCLTKCVRNEPMSGMHPFASCLEVYSDNVSVCWCVSFSTIEVLPYVRVHKLFA